MTDSVEDLKRQLRQLQELVDSGVLSADAARAGRSELEQRLVAAVMAQPSAVASAPAAAVAVAPHRLTAAQGGLPPSPSWAEFAAGSANLRRFAGS